MNQKQIKSEVNKIIKDKEKKEIIIGGRKYTSIVSLETVNRLYDEIYNFLAERFDRDIVKEKLKIEEIYSLDYRILSINLELYKNVIYKFAPIDDDNILQFMHFYKNNKTIEESIIGKNKSEIFLREKDVIDILKENLCIFIQAKSLELKNNCFENRMYLNAVESFYIGTLNSECKNIEEKEVFENNWLAAIRYINERTRCKIENKEFLAEIYELKSRIEMAVAVKLRNSKKYEDESYNSFKKAIEISPKNQFVINLGLTYLYYELLIMRDKKVRIYDRIFERKYKVFIC